MSKPKKLLVIEIDGIVDVAEECKRLGWTPIFLQTENYSDWLPLEELHENYDIRSYKELSCFDIIRVIKEENVDAVLPISLLEPEGVRDGLVKNYIRNFKLPVTIIANSPVTMESTFDKWLTKEVLLEASIPITPGSVIFSNEEVLDIEKTYGFPIIIKERKSFTGKGVRIINNQKDFEKYLLRNKSKNLFVEPFIVGMEVSLEVISWRGKKIFQPLVYKGETRMNILEHPVYRPLLSPYKKGSKLEKKINSIASKAVDILKLEGAADFDFIIANGEPYIMEINPRISGISKLCTAAGGVNVYKELTHMSIKNSISKRSKVPKKRYAIQLPLTKLAEGSFLKELQGNPSIEYIKPVTWMPILPIRSKVIISDNNVDELYKKMIDLEKYSHSRYIEEAKKSFDNF